MARPSRLGDAEISKRLAALPGWVRTGDAITRTFKFKGFPDAVAFVGRLVAPAEAMDHHPNVDIRYNRVVVMLSTHDAGGITAYDFDLAAQIDPLGA
jgi:4a-hydroxytetrahydrobiopterin dehydratase